MASEYLFSFLVIMSIVYKKFLSQNKCKHSLNCFTFDENKCQQDSKIPLGVMAKVLDPHEVVSEFELQLCYCIHLWTNALGKGMYPLTSQLWIK